MENALNCERMNSIKAWFALDLQLLAERPGVDDELIASHIETRKGTSFEPKDPEGQRRLRTCANLLGERRRRSPRSQRRAFPDRPARA